MCVWERERARERERERELDMWATVIVLILDLKRRTYANKLLTCHNIIQKKNHKIENE